MSCRRGYARGPRRRRYTGHTLRIGLVTATYLPSRNGVATSTALLAGALRALGHEVRVFAPQHPRAGSEDGVYRLPSLLFGAPQDYPLLLPLPGRAAAGLPLADLDVLHTMHPFVAGQTALAWARALRVPLLFTAHTQYHEYLHYARMPRRVSRPLVRRHVRAFAQAADRVLVPGRAMKAALRAYGYRGAVTRLPNPVDVSAFAGHDRLAARAALGLDPDRPVQVYLGRLAGEKNLGTLLAAHACARRTVPGLTLLVVGDGPQREALERKETPDVRFVGAVDYARVPGMLAAADAFVTASVSEVLPMSMLEALAAGLPLVVARSPAADDLVQDGVNGLLCGASAPDLAGGMVRMLGDPAALARLRQGAQASAAGHDAARVAARLAHLYAALISVRAVPRTA